MSRPSKPSASSARPSTSSVSSYGASSRSSAAASPLRSGTPSSASPKGIKPTAPLKPIPSGYSSPSGPLSPSSADSLSMNDLSLKSKTDRGVEGGGRRKLPARLMLGDEKDDVYTIRFSPDSKFIAAGGSDGVVKVYSVASGKQVYSLASDDSLPVTSIRWRPELPGQLTKNILVSANAEGNVRHWHVTTNKCVHTIKEEGNQTYCVDYRADGERFATAGKDVKVRIYDEVKKTLINTLSGGHGDVTAGHASRVFSLKFSPQDPNVVLTGGWDNTIQIWDLRVDHAVRSIFGPHICGDSVDIYDSTVLSGSWRQDKPLQTWDYGTGRLLDTIDWKLGLGEEPCLLYAAQFSKGNEAEYIVAGGSGSNECRVFNRRTQQVLGGIWGLKKGVYAVDFSSDSRSLIVGGGSMLHLYELHFE